MITESTRLEIKPIQTFSEALDVRRVRNERYVRERMTSNQSRIGLAEQWLWFKSVDRKTVFTASLRNSEKVIGYGICANKKGYPKQTWLTGALVSSARGFGYGRQLFQLLVDQSKDDVRLTVWDWNDRALTLYKSLDFKQYAHVNKLVYMRLLK